MERFLSGVERRALRMAGISTGSVDDALDIVQDAMMKLAGRYANRNESEWGGLFQRILQNSIADWHRRHRVRNRWRVFFTRDDRESETADPLGSLADPANPEPAKQLHEQDAMERLESAIHDLPLRQQQAFMLRLWEGLSVADTARAMGCSQGSVKTHYSRAVNSLRRALEGYWP
ncbi:MAG: RNA polymerase sigma factor [Candidatus Thiodiazotropha sp. (ex Dulcina madagascariensis)]|nr:RNA polymerase sigma factor [Candidatus Thiodiazotropha sp. (ex Dulcina madagascariensis)]MCU7929073.1 RNA polymerase sigma factor [Candidatus Thiodiazotropha sp. (ex Dulcina madagascariensis)]